MTELDRRLLAAARAARDEAKASGDLSMLGEVARLAVSDELENAERRRAEWDRDNAGERFDGLG